MDEQTIERAVEAAAKAHRANMYATTPSEWDGLDDDVKNVYRGDVRPIVTAALEAVETSAAVLPVIHCNHLGPEDTTGTHLREMAHRLGTDKLMGSNATAAAKAVLRAYAAEIDRIEAGDDQWTVICTTCDVCRDSEEEE